MIVAVSTGGAGVAGGTDGRGLGVAIRASRRCRGSLRTITGDAGTLLSMGFGLVGELFAGSAPIARAGLFAVTVEREAGAACGAGMATAGEAPGAGTGVRCCIQDTAAITPVSSKPTGTAQDHGVRFSLPLAS